MLLELLESPYFAGKEKFADLSELSVLHEIKGLETLSELEELSKLKGQGILMSDLFGQYSDVNAEYKNTRIETLIAYEEHYMKLLRNYKNEISEIESMMEQLRRERENFYSVEFPKIEHMINEDDILSEETKKVWISELRSNMEKSFEISEALIQHYVTSNINEFKYKMQSEMNRV